MNAHDNTYHDLLVHILDHGEEHDDRTGVGTTSVFGYQCRYDISETFPLLTTKRVWWKGVVEELFWFLSGSTNARDLQQRGVTIWDEWATAEQCARFGREEGDLGPVYGHLWRKFGQQKYVDGVDQIQRLVADLLNNPGSRRHIVTGWDPRVCDRVALPPCHTLFQFKVRVDPQSDTNLLDCQLYQRSADAFLGVPFNLASYALLTYMIARVCGYRPGRFIHTFGDLHIYSNHMDQVEEQLNREPYVPPKVRIAVPASGGFDALESLTPDDVELLGYHHHPPIKAAVAV